MSTILSKIIFIYEEDTPQGHGHKRTSYHYGGQYSEYNLDLTTNHFVYHCRQVVKDLLLRTLPNPTTLAQAQDMYNVVHA